MSKVRKPRFAVTNSSIHNGGLAHHLLLSTAMSSPQLRSHGLQFHGLLQHRVVAVPLHEIRTAHECAMFAGTPVIMPQIEIYKIDRLREGRTGEHSFAAQSSD